MGKYIPKMCSMGKCIPKICSMGSISHSILFRLWSVVIGVVQGRMTVIPHRHDSMYLFERLQYFMRELKSFFHAGGNGMELPTLENEAYKVT